MKWIIRIITFGILGTAIVAPFFIKNKSGQPMMSLPTADDLTPSLGKELPVGGGKRVFYKWQDERGRWSYGDEKPSNIENVELVSVDINANVMQALPKETSVESQTSEPSGRYPKAQGYAPPASSDDTLTLDRALNIVEDAHAVKKLMESRNQALDGDGVE
jgi:hypothetical protein